MLDRVTEKAWETDLSVVNTPPLPTHSCGFHFLIDHLGPEECGQTDRQRLSTATMERGTEMVMDIGCQIVKGVEGLGWAWPKPNPPHTFSRAPFPLSPIRSQIPAIKFISLFRRSLGCYSPRKEAKTAFP